jgi:PKD repeat protein
MFKMIKPILYAMFSLLYFGTTAQIFHIDGYVVLEENLQPVESQVVEIYDKHGEKIAWFFTDNQGFYSGDFDVTAASTTYVVAELWRVCNGVPILYSEQIGLNQLYLTASFMVCKDQECKAQFNVNRTNLKQLQFEFTDVSQGDITSWNWDFGDGSFSSKQNPVHVYQQPDHYQVKLTISGVNCNDRRHRSVFAFPRDCLSKFSWEQVSQGNNLMIQFIDESLGRVNSWDWDFGDGSISDEQNPVHQYESPGEYEVELTISRPGCWDATRNFILVQPLPQCYAHFGGTQIMSEKFEMAFTDLSISDPLTSRFWQFGDGSISNLKNPVHVYENAGVYDVSLTIETENCSNTFVRNMKVVGIAGCLADFDFDQTDPDVPGVYFENLSPADSLLYFWDFGDGTISNDFSPDHLYSNFGDYTVKLRILGFGCSDSISKIIELPEPVYCGADFTFQQAFPQSRVISFTNQSFGNGISSSWDFGDGNSSSQTNPLHEYLAAGQYQVQLMITTADQCTDSLTQFIEISPPLTISGSVWADESLLNFGSVLLYRGVSGPEIELYSQAELSDGSFVFSDLIPGTYFLQAIPSFDFPFPTIPNYFPTYLHQTTRWQQALQIDTDNIPVNIQIQLLQYSEFFDGKALLKGSVIQEQKNSDILMIIYLTDEAGQLRDFRIVEEDNTFEFLNIPYAYYKVYPEKAGKSGQTFSVELNEGLPEMDNLIFIENQQTIYPDLTSINEQIDFNFNLSPNPAGNYIIVSLSDALFAKCTTLRIYSVNGLSAPISSLETKTTSIDISELPEGVYVLELDCITSKVHRKFIIQR